MSNPEIVQALIGSLQDENHLVRGAAARALGRTADPAVVPALLQALRDKAGLVYDFALNALIEMHVDDPTVVTTLLGMVDDPDADIRRAAATLLGKQKASEAVPVLINLLGDEVLAVGHAAAEALGEIGDIQALAALVEILASPHTDWAMCINAAQAVGKLGDASAAPTLINVFRRRWDVVPGMNTTPPVRKHVMEALVRLGEGAVPYLVTTLSDADVKVRHGVVETLGHLGNGSEAVS
jgi:HEAT repeat protein